MQVLKWEACSTYVPGKAKNAEDKKNYETKMKIWQKQKKIPNCSIKYYDVFPLEKAIQNCNIKKIRNDLFFANCWSFTLFYFSGKNRNCYISKTVNSLQKKYLNCFIKCEYLFQMLASFIKAKYLNRFG
jgi:hypothetical protein